MSLAFWPSKEGKSRNNKLSRESLAWVMRPSASTVIIPSDMLAKIVSIRRFSASTAVCKLAFSIAAARRTANRLKQTQIVLVKIPILFVDRLQYANHPLLNLQGNTNHIVRLEARLTVNT